MIKIITKSIKLIKILLRLGVPPVISFLTPKIMYPRIVNFPVTNKCTYKCVMCNVWKSEHSSQKDMSSAEIKKVFSKPLFKKVKHVGISGGEPFIRKDINEVVIGICEAVPGLKSISIITNASLDTTVLKTQQIKEILDSRGISFHLEVSVDGIGSIHDENRGCSGAFEKTINNVYALKKLGLIDRISTTITKINCNNLWEIYQFARLNNIPIKYRLASRIDRLYNSELVNNFSFTHVEKLKIIKFLENLVFYYEKDNLNSQLFYTSLINQLKGGRRQSGCDWKTSKGVSLDPYGNLYFCFPKSKLVCNINSEVQHDIKILSENSSLLKDCLKSCDFCTHDYAGYPDLGFGLKFISEKYVKPTINYLLNTKLLSGNYSANIKNSTGPVKKVAIIGWYGTETLGDKAILGGIIDNLIKDNISLDDITVVSLHPSYTQLTLVELGLEKLSVVDAYKVKSSHKFINSQDLFIFGGGPLCDVEPLLDMLEIFINAKKNGKKTFIYAAGIGPLVKSRNIKALNKMIALTDRICLRDRLSLNKYKNQLPSLSERNDVNICIDPATNYVRNRISLISSTPLIESEYVLFCIRDWPVMYADGLSLQEYNEINSHYKMQMLNLIDYVRNSGYKVVFMPMHNFYIGDDDRELYLYYIKDLPSTNNIGLISHDYTPAEALNYFKYAKFVVCMRFHSVVLSATCNTPFIAIDYHYGKGKISGFLDEVGLTSQVYNIDSFITEQVDRVVNNVLSTDFDWEKVNKIIETKNIALEKFMSVTN